MDKNSAETDEGPEPPLDFTVSLVDGDGTAVCFPISRFRRVPPVLKSSFLKLKDESALYGKSYEPTLQLFELPLADFAAVNLDFNPSTLQTIHFVFDSGREGIVFLDRLGFAR